jgi:hypothetical protein
MVSLIGLKAPPAGNLSESDEETRAIFNAVPIEEKIERTEIKIMQIQRKVFDLDQ